LTAAAAVAVVAAVADVHLKFLEIKVGTSGRRVEEGHEV
jgi:hypothetical protein